MLEILVGMIASGKSSYAEKRAGHGAIIINDDSIVMALHRQYDRYRPGLKPLYKHIELQILSFSLSFGQSVVLDRPCLKRSTRIRLIEVARMLDCPVRCVLFPMRQPHEHARRRFEHDPRGKTYDHWKNVAQKHFETYEIPMLAEGFTEIVTPAQALELVTPNH